MSERLVTRISWLILLFLAGLGIWMIMSDRMDFGMGLIAGAVGASILRLAKQKRIQEQQAQGLNPYDERAYVIGWRASYLTLRIIIILAALIVLAGSIFAPAITVNPYNFTGIGLCIIVLIYMTSYWYYNRRM